MPAAASSNAIATTEKRSAYSASKRGLVGLVQSAALDCVERGIRNNALIPGTTDTALVRRVAHMENVRDAEKRRKLWRNTRVASDRLPPDEHRMTMFPGGEHRCTRRSAKRSSAHSCY
ncbi:SDR family oxidoreductase [Terriglobus albidus]|uniref:SDR family oxidoreductase n=1 Tax=Terriglobus albidus TaxID=1592106 RepID=UPI0037D9D7E0